MSISLGRQLEAELIELRRQFHQNPELGYEEYDTSAFIKDYLIGCGLSDIKIINKTGVVGMLEGSHSGKTLLLRADMDALPVQEDTGLSFASKNPGKMHACGHDGHTAILLIAAKMLSARKEDIHGRIKFFFQPNEEGTGALASIEDGLLENPSVDFAAALHLWSQLEIGKIGVASGAAVAGLEGFIVRFLGKGGHSGSPHQAIDPIIAVSQAVISIQQIQTRQLNMREPTVIVVGRISGGNAGNIIPQSAEIEGTMRFLYEDENAQIAVLKEKFEQVIRGVALSSGTEYEIIYSTDNSPAVINNPQMVDLARQVSAGIVGQSNAIDYSVLVGEDFSEISARVPSVFSFVGCGNSEKNQTFPHHHPKFDLDEDSLRYGVQLHVEMALTLLR